MAAQVVHNLIMLLLLIGLISMVLSVPTGSSTVKKWNIHNRIAGCKDVKCKFGLAELDRDRNFCVCPSTRGQQVRHFQHSVQYPHSLIFPQYKQLQEQIVSFEQELCGLLKTCPPGFEFEVNYQAENHGKSGHDLCACIPTCDENLCPTGRKIVRTVSGCDCILDCGQTCPSGEVRDYDKFSDNCICRSRSWPEHVLGVDTIAEQKDLFKFLSRRQTAMSPETVAEVEGMFDVLTGRQNTTALTSPSATATQAASFTGSPTPLPSGINTSDPAIATFVPPPKTDITPALIQQSMNQQPQSTATIISAIPYFKVGTIIFGIQLAGGPVVGIIAMNASTTIPCGTIGSSPGPSLVVVPHTVTNGTTQITLPDCLVIAVNMYTPEVITFWVQRPDSSVFSVSSDNKLHDLERINTTVPAFADILTTDTNYTKRDWELPTIKVEEPVELAARGLQEINAYTAIMSSKSCAAMTCNSNKGPALYNPFLRTCYCQTIEYAEVNPSGDSV